MKQLWIWRVLVIAMLAALALGGCSSSSQDPTDGDQSEDGDTPTDGDEDGDVDTDGDVVEDGDLDGDVDGDVDSDGDIIVDGDQPDGDWVGSKCDIDRNANDRDVTSTGGTVQICIEGDPLDGTAFRIPKSSLPNDIHMVIQKVDDLTVDGWVPVGPAIQFKATPVNEGESVVFEVDGSISIPFVAADMPEGARDFHIQR
jgi:hypothetical protein